MNNYDLKCLRCGAELQFLGREKLQLGQASWIFGDLPHLLKGGLAVDILSCPQCGKLEFYQSGSDDEGLPQKRCPKCGAMHDFDYGRCPNCKYEY